jgi:hypothetical protein
MKDVARYRQRQGGILEARGDAAGAVAAYDEAFRVNPTDVPTMAGLGRLAHGAARLGEGAAGLPLAGACRTSTPTPA